MDTDLTFIEDFELEEIIVSPEESITLFGNAMLWINGKYCKIPLNLYMDYDSLQVWLRYEPQLLTDYILTFISDYLSSGMEEPYVIESKEFANTFPVILSSSFILYSTEGVCSDELLIGDLGYPENFIVKEVLLLKLTNPPVWDEVLEEIFGVTMMPLKLLYTNFLKAQDLIARGYDTQQALNMLHLNFPHLLGILPLVEVFQNGLTDSKKDSFDEEELPF